MNTKKLSFAKIAVVTLTAQLMLSACAAKNTAAVVEEQADEVVATDQKTAPKALTREEILARYDQQKGVAPRVAVTVPDATPVVAAPIVQPGVVEAVQQAAVVVEEQVTPVVVQKPAPKPQQVSAKPNPTGYKACPADKIYGKWMSQEVRQGPNNELIPAAIGYMFREDGFFATALFNVVTGEKQGEFEGSYKTVKGKTGKCAVEFKVPSRGILNRLEYKFKSGILEVDDRNSNSRATLERI